MNATAPCAPALPLVLLAVLLSSPDATAEYDCAATAPPVHAARPARTLQRMSAHALCHHRSLVEAAVLRRVIAGYEEQIDAHEASKRTLRKSTAALAGVLRTPAAFTQDGLHAYLYAPQGLAHQARLPDPPATPPSPADHASVMDEALALLETTAPAADQRPPPRRKPGNRPQPVNAPDRLDAAIAAERAANRRETPPTALEGVRARNALAHAALRAPPPEDPYRLPGVTNALAVQAARRHVLQYPNRYLTTPTVPGDIACVLAGRHFDPPTETCVDRAQHPPGTPQHWLRAFHDERELACLTEPIESTAAQKPWLRPRCTGALGATRRRAASGLSRAWRALSNGAHHARALLHTRLQSTSTAAQAARARDALHRAALQLPPTPARDKALCLAAVLDACATPLEPTVPSRAPWRSAAVAHSPCTARALDTQDACRTLP